ncbi:hypothetical protein SI65_09232 [Aspergillus cristatus]|uniref:Uncharacterized protein n=1 Tax=Aspergillus cristatus TaxID=573508 RepID=A0A1E3B395_ASPCR|nr:hypothetical protein SI65_09232 [Aspergillus cristatus]
MDRVAFPNVFIFNANTGALLGGVRQNGSLTEANFLFMLNVLLITTTPFQVVQRTSGRAISSTNDSLQEGEYDVPCESEIRMTDEAFVQRVISSNQSGKANEFTYGIRGRDGRCTMSVEQEGAWVDTGFRRWVTDAAEHTTGINSLQNGSLMKGDIHENFNNYLISGNLNES